MSPLRTTDGSYGAAKYWCGSCCNVVGFFCISVKIVMRFLYFLEKIAEMCDSSAGK